MGRQVREEHLPDGHPCKRCGQSAYSHRVSHQSKGDPCEVCGLPEFCHRPREYRGGRGPDIFAGIDGEGQGRNPHRYNFLACRTEDGSRSWWVENQEGLNTERCLDFIVNLPEHVNVFAYAFNYDLTKILQDCDDRTLWYLFRPEQRIRGGSRVRGPRPVYWRGFYLNLQASKFSVKKNGRTRIIWDVFKFFQSKFVGALEDWKVGSPELWERMQKMKDKRSEFDKVPFGKVKEYCLEECQCMGQLARKLVNAHEAAGLHLKTFYGAGSSASAMLTKMGVKEKITPPPKELERPIAQAFFGGRFENSIVGAVPGTVYNYDISSAYPYQLCFLPCLLHGKWYHTKKRADLETARTALVHYRISTSASRWCPFPFRDKKGSICYPAQSGGGWVWLDEYLAGERIFKATEFREAYVYHTDCDCQPFEQIPKYYLERLRIGKEGPGIVLKLGMNSCYGKLAQSIGQGQFNCWIWAGLITSGCRAQILDMLAIHEYPANLLMVATDGIYTREKLTPPAPRDTGTDVEVIDQSNGKKVRKPLGGWEETIHEQGVFVARPGIYFPLNPSQKQIKKIRGRGIGKSVVLEQWRTIIECWDKHRDTQKVHLTELSRFSGAKSSIHRRIVGKEEVFKRADGTGSIEGHSMPSYGEWLLRPVDMTFNPMPKRESINPDNTLKLRRLNYFDESVPYKKSMNSEDAKILRLLTQELLEQPDCDHTEYQ